ncbi:MAG TPA: hypothetical protein VMU11_01170 [Verrucomicrobiae bacterium]|nr:hypothetical protein [Verrucomicrobiae bacterium]
MKGSFFLITFLLVLLLPSLAGCASGGAKVHLPAAQAASDAGRVFAADAGSHLHDAQPEVTASDAAIPPDAWRMPAAPDAAMSSSDPEEHLLRIGLSPAVRAQCPAGWRLRLWLTDPPVESTRGLDLELHIPDLTYWGPWSSITLWCDERMPQWYVWNSSDMTAMGSGAFSELSLDGFDLRAATRLCDDPLAPGEGERPIILWDAARRGTCPP